MKKQFIIIIMIFSIFLNIFFIINLFKNENIEKIWEKCIYGKDKNWKCRNLDFLRKNNLKYADFWYIIKNKTLYISDRFSLFNDRNLFILKDKLDNIKDFSFENMGFSDIFYILKNLKQEKINSLRLNCFNISEENIENFIKFVNKKGIQSLFIDNILCWKQELNKNIAEKLVNLKLENLNLNLEFEKFEDIKYFLENTKTKKVNIWICSKNWKKIDLKDEELFCWVK